MRCLFVVLLFMSSTAAAQVWQEIAMLDPNGSVLLVDASDITEVKGYRRAWFKWDYRTDQPIPSKDRESVPKAKRFRWARSARLFHCQEQATALAEQRWFNSKDKELGSRRPEALQFFKVSPASIEERMLETVCKSEFLRSIEGSEEEARMTHAAKPRAYYPEGSIRRGEEGTARVKACVDSTGKLLGEPVVTVSSGFSELDRAAVQLAKDSGYRPGMRDGTALPESCLESPVTFRQQKKTPESAAEATWNIAASPDNDHPRDARGREEQQGSPVVRACVGRNGKLLRDPVIAVSSGSLSLDAAAIKVAKAAKYTAATSGGERLPESCTTFKVKFARDAE